MPTLYTTLSVKELIDKPLNWAVAKAQGFELYKDEMLNGVTKDGWWISGYYPGDLNSWIPLASYTPAENHAQGGPIQVQEFISVCVGDCVVYPGVTVQSWVAWSLQTEVVGDGPNYEGQTPLEAIMRCLVASKLGDFVDIPEDLK